MYNIMYCCNDKVYDGILIAALSYIKYNDEAVNMYILTMDLTEIDEKYTKISKQHVATIEHILKYKNKNSKVTVIDCKEEYLKELKGSKNILNSYTPYAMLRLFADRYLDMDKILYLDTDVVVNGSLKSLFDTDILEYEYAGVRDYLGRVFIYPNYINSGVLLMNLKKIKETGLFNKCINQLKVKKYAFPDQTVLNKFVLKKKFLPKIYNYQHKYNKKCVLKHFCKTILWRPFYVVNVKPWEIDKIHSIYKIHEFDDIFSQYLDIKEAKVNV